VQRDSEAGANNNKKKVDINAYIESGILEAYVLDALDVFERAEVAANIAKYPEVATEVAAIEEAMRSYAEAHAEVPPAGMQEKIWEAISSESKDHANGSAKTSSFTQTIPLVPTVRRRQYRWANAAMLAVLVGSLAVNIMLWSQGNKANEEVAAVKKEMQSMQQQQTELVAALDAYKQEKDMMADSAMQSIQMKSMVPGHPMVATVYWNKGKGEAYLSMQKLPAPEKGKQYQMWVIQDGKPVSMGVIPMDMTEGNVAKLPMEVKDGQAFAISLENEGGNPTPTQVYVLGAIKA
jgi:anti-sigma-K factor RskA